MSEKRTETITVKMELTEHDRAQYANEMAALLGRHADMDFEKKEAAKDFSAKLAVIMADAQRIARTIDLGWHQVTVACYVVIDGRSRKAFYYDDATDELVKTRDITDDELQAALPMDMPAMRTRSRIPTRTGPTLYDINNATFFYSFLVRKFGKQPATEFFS